MEGNIMENKTSKKTAYKKPLLLILCILLLIHGVAYAKVTDADKTLIIYYSRTGKSKQVCDTLQQHLNADLLEVKDLKNRSGMWGYVTAAFDSFFDRCTSIEPEHPDLSSYCSIIVVTPVWNWKISTPIRTLIRNNRFDGKKLVIFTTANIDIKKYEKFGQEAPFIKRFLRDYLRGKREEMQSLVSTSGAVITGHYHIETEKITDKQITGSTLAFIGDLKGKLSLKPCLPTHVACREYNP
jgi:flavodoxin